MSAGRMPVRRRREVQVRCPKCGKLLWLTAETEGWERRRGKWCHESYGPATGDCCGLAMIDVFGRIECFKVEEPEVAKC